MEDMDGLQVIRVGTGLAAAEQAGAHQQGRAGMRSWHPMVTVARALAVTPSRVGVVVAQHQQQGPTQLTQMLGGQAVLGLHRQSPGLHRREAVAVVAVVVMLPVRMEAARVGPVEAVPAG